MSQELRITDAEGTRVFSIPEKYIGCVQVWKEMLETGRPDVNDDMVHLDDYVNDLEAVVSWLFREDSFKITTSNVLALLRLSDKYQIVKLKTDIDNAFTLGTAALLDGTNEYIFGAIHDLPQTEARGRQDVVSNLHRYLTLGKFKEMFIQLMQLHPTKVAELVTDALAYKDSITKADFLESEKKRHEEGHRVRQQQKKLDEIIDCCQNSLVGIRSEMEMTKDAPSAMIVRGKVSVALRPIDRYQHDKRSGSWNQISGPWSYVD